MTSVNSIIAKFREPIFAAIDENGKIVRMPPGDEWHNHPLASKARWIGGTEDTDIVRAAFAMLTKLGSRGGILAIEWKSGADSADMITPRRVWGYVTSCSAMPIRRLQCCHRYGPCFRLSP